MRGFSDEATISAVRKLSKDSIEWVRREALSVLAESADARRVDALLEALRDDKPMVRCLAALKLGSVTTTPVIESLIGMLDDQDPAVRQSALRAIAQLKDPTAQDTVMKISRSDPDPKVRARAYRVVQLLTQE